MYITEIDIEADANAGIVDVWVQRRKLHDMKIRKYLDVSNASFLRALEAQAKLMGFEKGTADEWNNR